MPTFRSDDGTDIFYRCWGDGLGVPVVLHHGFIADSELDWVSSGVVADLLAAGLTVVAQDARGHGRSGKPYDPERYGEARMARDLSILIDVLGVPMVDLVGYSMGAVVSLIAASHDRRVRRLVVGGLGAATVEQGGVDRKVLAPAVLREALLTSEPAGIVHPVAAAMRWLADANGADRLALAAHSSAVRAQTIRLQSVHVPTLVLAGRDDDLAARPEILAGAIPRGRLRLVGGDHGGALRNPEFAAALTHFLVEDMSEPA
jgi:pimeloyl-ACP methyl ester carboxylesterase